MSNINIITSSNETFIYNEISDSYEYHCSSIKNNWIFVSNNKLYVKVDNKFEYLKESNYDKNIIYYEDDNYKIAVKESQNIFVYDMQNRYVYDEIMLYNCEIQYDKIMKIDNNKYFIHNIINIGTSIEITRNIINITSYSNSCLECCLNWENMNRYSKCHSHGKNIYCVRYTDKLIQSPYTLLFGNHKSYVLCSVENWNTETINEYIITNMEKNIHDNNTCDKIIAMPVRGGFEKIMKNCNINISSSKYFSQSTKLTDQNAFVFHDGMKNKDYFIYLNFKGICAVFEMFYERDYCNMIFRYTEPKQKFIIDISLFPLGIIYANVTRTRNKYFITMLSINGTVHEYIVDNSNNEEKSEYIYKKKERPDQQLIKINNKDKFTILNDIVKIQLKTFLLVLKHKKINISKFLVRNIMELSLI